MCKAGMPKEFVGRFIFFYKDGDVIYAYDEITHGLFKFVLGNREVMLVLPSSNIHRSTTDRIMGISKNKNEIILIPLFLNSEWIFYDLESGIVRYELPLLNKIRISGAITIDGLIFLIPFNTYHPIIIFSLDDMKIIKVYEKWYKQYVCKENKDTFISGVSRCGRFVFFYVVNSNHIGCLNMEDLRVITLAIPCSVLSISVDKDKVWILPAVGKHIYAADFKGKIIDKVNLSGIEIKSSDFTRIIATKKGIFLLPVYGTNIWVYQFERDKIFELKANKNYLWGRMFAQVDAPYWEYILEDKIMHLLPCDFRYKKVDLDSFEMNEFSLQYGNNIKRKTYGKMIMEVQKENIFERGNNDLEELIRFIPFLEGKYFVEKGITVGNRIWKRTDE